MHYDITSDPLDVAALERMVRDPGAGALVTFVGYVRERSDDGRLVTGLSYEAHPELALRTLREIGAEASTRFGSARVAIAHRIGALALGEAAGRDRRRFRASRSCVRGLRIRDRRAQSARPHLEERTLSRWSRGLA